MKKIFAILTVSFVLIVYFSCDKVSPPYMKTNGADTTSCPPYTFSPKTNPHKVVLIEDYTGHQCPNCPAAATLLHNFKQQYGDSIILIAIHAGDFAEPSPAPFNDIDLRCEAGNQLNDHYAPIGNPAAAFNRKLLGGSRTSISTPEWQTKLNQTLHVQPELDMQVKVTNYDATKRKACISIQTQYLQSTTKKLMLSVYITEDSIIGNQKDGPSVIVPNYVFMHVLRGTVNGTWGDVLSNTSVNANSLKDNKYATILDQKWTPKNCNIVAFVYDSITEEIIQAAETKVIE